MNEPTICECGCGGEIPWKPHHKTRPPRFIQGHHFRKLPPETYALTPDNIPAGYCECGCGQRTPIAAVTNARRRHFAGHPMPRLRGHGERARGAKHPGWKGGKYMRRGYVMIHAPDHPHADSKGYVPEHQLVACEKLGRWLKPGEIVHHINEVTDDNRPENLVVLDREQHRALHRAAHSERMKQFHRDNPNHARAARAKAKGDWSAAGRKGAEARWGKKT